VQDARGAAARAGVQQGDVLLAVNGTSVRSVEQVREAVAKSDKSVALLIQRGEQRILCRFASVDPVVAPSLQKQCSRVRCFHRMRSGARSSGVLVRRRGQGGPCASPTTTPALLLACSAGAAQAFQISSLSPQGEVDQVRQLRLRFDEAAIDFGQPQAPAPLALRCDDAGASRGSGRWLNEREWVFDFEQDLPPGVACELQTTPGLSSPRARP
jgi:hypothetical protein